MHHQWLLKEREREQVRHRFPHSLSLAMRCSVPLLACSRKRAVTRCGPLSLQNWELNTPLDFMKFHHFKYLIIETQNRVGWLCRAVSPVSASDIPSLSPLCVFSPSLLRECQGSDLGPTLIQDDLISRSFITSARTLVPKQGHLHTRGSRIFGKVILQPSQSC